MYIYIYEKTIEQLKSKVNHTYSSSYFYVCSINTPYAFVLIFFYFILRIVTAVWAVRDKRFNCGTVLTVIKMYRYMIYVEIFVTVTAVRDGAVRNIRSVKTEC